MAIFLLICGLFFLLWTWQFVSALKATVAFYRRAHLVRGKVTKKRRASMEYVSSGRWGGPYVGFLRETSGGKYVQTSYTATEVQYTVSEKHYSLPTRPLPKGQSQVVWYDPDNPHQATIGGDELYHAIRTACIFLGINALLFIWALGLFLGPGHFPLLLLAVPLLLFTLVPLGGWLYARHFIHQTIERINHETLEQEHLASHTDSGGTIDG